MTINDPLTDTTPTWLSEMTMMVRLQRQVLSDLETGVPYLGPIEHKVAGRVIVLDQELQVYTDRWDGDILNVLTATEKTQLQAMMNRLALLLINAWGLPAQS
jgi:hypothetical protein